MRPLLVGPNAPLEIMDNAYPDDEARGSISRLMIAERRGLARETVRRKVNKLIKSGMLYETEDGRARPIRDLSNPPVAARGRRNLQGRGTL
jgi:DeoR/GlpR family transcriptional regulator of sugar metabolism